MLHTHTGLDDPFFQATVTFCKGMLYRFYGLRGVQDHKTKCLLLMDLPYSTPRMGFLTDIATLTNKRLANGNPESKLSNENFLPSRNSFRSFNPVNFPIWKSKFCWCSVGACDYVRLPHLHLQAIASWKEYLQHPW